MLTIPLVCFFLSFFETSALTLLVVKIFQCPRLSTFPLPCRGFQFYCGILDVRANEQNYAMIAPEAPCDEVLENKSR